MSAAAGRQERVRELRRTLAKSQRPGLEQTVIPTGLSTLDALLPGGGLPAGGLVEWVSAEDGQCACSLALRSTRSFLKRAGCLAVVDDDHSFNPDCLHQHRVPLQRLLLIRPDSGLSESTAPVKAMSHGRGQLGRANSISADGLWALEQAARCAGVRVVLCRLDRVSSTVLRRLQLAVERSGATVFLIRPASVLSQPTWADLRIFAEPSAVRTSGGITFDVRLVRSRQAVIHHGHARLKFDHETGAVSEISELAGTATAATV